MGTIGHSSGNLDLEEMEYDKFISKLGEIDETPTMGPKNLTILQWFPNLSGEFMLCENHP